MTEEDEIEEQDSAPESDSFDDGGERATRDTFVVDVEGYEGPLDLLLALARTHKLDLARISILRLAEQYLAFIEEARRLRLEIAADYLVMAAWLAFLKSKLLLPEDKDGDEPTGEELAAQLAFRLKRLEAMRDSAARLMTRKRLGQDIFPRGMPEGIKLVRSSAYDASVYDLLAAYAMQRQRTAVDHISFKPRPVLSLQEARKRLERILGQCFDWAPLDRLLLDYLTDPDMRRSVMASSLGATLELTREGKAELRQARPYAPLYMRKKGAAA
ncbi:MAG: ScpA family protein [Pseudomonadota bacterium]|nr:ScpA family protein [Pseudomonadota bacterium]